MLDNQHCTASGSMLDLFNEEWIPSEHPSDDGLCYNDEEAFRQFVDYNEEEGVDEHTDRLEHASAVMEGTEQERSIEEREPDEMDHNDDEGNNQMYREGNLDLSSLATTCGPLPPKMTIDDINKALDTLLAQTESTATQSEAQEIAELAGIPSSSTHTGGVPWSYQAQGQEIHPGAEDVSSGPNILSIQQIISRQVLAHLRERNDLQRSGTTARAAAVSEPANITPHRHQFSHLHPEPAYPQQRQAFSTREHSERSETGSDPTSEAIFSASSPPGPTTPLSSPVQSRRLTSSTQSGPAGLDPSRVCSVCNEIFKTGADCRKHKKYHMPFDQRPFPCDECPKRFVDQHILDRHKTSHSDERTAQCDICGKRLKRKDALPRHKRTHQKGHSEA